MKKSNGQVEMNWQKNWREILEKPDGSIDVAQLKLELMDFSDMMERMRTLTHKITNGQMSYATYTVEAILQSVDEAREQEKEYQKQDDKEDGVCSLCEREFEDNNDTFENDYKN